MADFNSVYTGEQIEQAITDMGRTKNYICIWGDCCSNGGNQSTLDVDITLLRNNPDTSSKAGMYIIIYSETEEPILDGSTDIITSNLTVTTSNQRCIGTSSVLIDSTTNDRITYSVKLEFNQFSAFKTLTPGNGDPEVTEQIWIHRILRYQNVQNSIEPIC